MHDDNLLMEMTKDGNKKAYEQLVLKYRTNAISFANSFVQNFHTSEDIVQECFAKLYINRQKYKPIFTFKTYLFTIIRNRCIDEQRRNKHSRHVELSHEADMSDDNTPEQIYIGKEHLQDVFAVLNSLRDDYKTSLYLYAVDEMSYEQIAVIMQKSIPQIKIIIYRARKMLKKLYKGDDIIEK